MLRKILFLGHLTDEQIDLVNQLTSKIWGLQAVCCGTMTSPQVLEFLPLTLKDCIFFIVDNCFFEESTTSNYKKVSESKQGCKVGLILTNNNETYYTEENKPDFIINTITGEFLIP